MIWEDQVKLPKLLNFLNFFAHTLCDGELLETP